MKNLLNKMLISQDKANHFIWTILVLITVLSGIVMTDTALELNLGFFFIIGLSFIIAALVGLVKEMRDYTSGKGTPSFLDTLANMSGLIAAFILIELAMIAYR